MASRRHHNEQAARPARARWIRIALVGLLTCVAAASAVLAAFVATDTPPRSLGPYLATRLEGHSESAATIGRWLGRSLTALDRGETGAVRLPRLLLAAAATPASDSGAASVVVSTQDDARRAIEQAEPGQTIVLQPGTYRLDDGPVSVARPGTASEPITVRAERRGSVRIEVATPQGFVVSAPHWIFENLELRGACAQAADCQHAFHVVGQASHFVLRNSTLTDFNAHVKVNGERGHFPDDGLVEGNTFTNTAPRPTDDPVTSIDLVGASGWTIRANVITDFVKSGGNRISFGAFAKGGGGHNRFERNVVVCEMALRGAAGWRVGLSLGGGGTAAAYCRDGPCITEQEDSAIDSNLIASCSDDGIYLNRAAMSRVVHNTVVDTAGVSVRFAESSADLAGNLVDGPIRNRDGAAIHGEDNLSTQLATLYLGRHPIRALFQDPGALDFSWRSPPPRRSVADGAQGLDLCGMRRPSQPAYGAFEDFTTCTRAPR